MKSITELTLKELVHKTIVHFVGYRKGNLWYTVSGFENFEFPVPIEDTGDGIFKASDSAMYYMRYIRKHLEEIKQNVLATHTANLQCPDSTGCCQK